MRPKPLIPTCDQFDQLPALEIVRQTCARPCAIEESLYLDNHVESSCGVARQILFVVVVRVIPIVDGETYEKVIWEPALLLETLSKVV